MHKDDPDFFKPISKYIGTQFVEEFLFYEKYIVYIYNKYRRTSYEGCCYPLYTDYTAINTVISVCIFLYVVIICISIKNGKRIERMYKKKQNQSITKSLV